MSDAPNEGNAPAPTETKVEPPAKSKFLPPCTGPDPNVAYPISVVYCGECSMPIECCSYSPDPAKCRQWLEKELPSLAAEMRLAEDAAGAGAKSGRQTRGGKGVARPAGAGGEPADNAAKPAPILEIAHCPRGKKFDSVVIGLPAFGIGVKDVSRQFAQRFSCGVSVQPVPASLASKHAGTDMLLIQADVLDKLKAFITETFPVIPRTAIQDIGVVKR